MLLCGRSPQPTQELLLPERAPPSIPRDLMGHLHTVTGGDGIGFGQATTAAKCSRPERDHSPGVAHSSADPGQEHPHHRTASHRLLLLSPAGLKSDHPSSETYRIRLLALAKAAAQLLSAD